MTGVKLQVDTHTNYTEFKNPVRKVYNLAEIPSPRDRIKFLRSYKTNVEEALRELDRIINRNSSNDKVILSNTLKEIEIE
jgi:hypothetical protein